MIVMQKRSCLLVCQTVLAMQSIVIQRFRISPMANDLHPIPVAQGKMQKLTYAKQYCSKANEEQNIALKGKNERGHTCGAIVFIALLFRSFFGNWRPKFPMQANTIVSFSGLKILFSAGNS